MNKVLIIYTDGGARGNPGPAGIGVAVYEEGDLRYSYKKYIGHATNNQAEYQALLLALHKAKELKASVLRIRCDSKLLVEQLRGNYKVKDKKLSMLFVQAWNALQSFQKVTFTHIPREDNSVADKLANEAMDEHTS